MDGESREHSQVNSSAETMPPLEYDESAAPRTTDSGELQTETMKFEDGTESQRQQVENGVPDGKADTVHTQVDISASELPIDVTLSTLSDGEKQHLLDDTQAGEVVKEKQPPLDDTQAGEVVKEKQPPLDDTQAGEVVKEKQLPLDDTQAGEVVKEKEPPLDDTQAGEVVKEKESLLDDSQAGEVVKEKQPPSQAGEVVKEKEPPLDDTQAGEVVKEKEPPLDDTQAGEVVKEKEPPLDDSQAGEVVKEKQPPLDDSQAGEVVKEKQPLLDDTQAGEVVKEKEREDGKWLDILGNGQLLKKVIRPGQDSSTRPTPQSRVRIRTIGLLEDGGVIDGHSSISFAVGEGDVIQAWDLSVSLMELGEVAQVKTVPRFAYGFIGRVPDVPPNATISYELELLEVLPPINFETVTEEQLQPIVEKKRVRGNELFQRQDFELAINAYKRALQLMQSYMETQSLKVSPFIKDQQIRCWNNMAASQMKLELDKEALEACENVLKYDPQNVKALFRSGKALGHLGELEVAVKRLRKAVSLDLGEKAIQVELKRMVTKRNEKRKEEKAMCQRMVKGVGETPSQQKSPKHKEKKAPVQDTKVQGPWSYLAVAAVVAVIGIGLAYFFTQRQTHTH